MRSFCLLVMLMFTGGCARRAEMPPETTYSPELKLRAEQGDLRSQHQLGVVLMQGAGVPENAEEGFRWVGKASQKNYAPSQFLCGVILRTTGSSDQGLELIERAAEQGLPEAQMSLGLIYLGGSGVPKDIEQAIYWFREAGEGGNGDAFTNLGYIYWDGNGVPKNRKKGAGYFKKAANMGFLHGQNDHAWFLATSPEAEDRNGREAVRWAERAVRQRRDCTTLDTLAAAYAEDGQFEKAVETQKEAIQRLKNVDEETLKEWERLPTLQKAEMRLRLYQKGMPFREEDAKTNEKRPEQPMDEIEAKAKGGDPEAQLQMFMQCQLDEATRLAWLERSAAQGYAPAQSVLGFEHYRQGEFKEAAGLYRKAADQGLAMGQHNLGVCYERGQGVRQDLVLAAEYYSRAARQGYPLAMYNLGLFYLRGLGVKKDLKQAEFWLGKAEAKVPEASSYLEELRKGNTFAEDEGKPAAGDSPDVPAIAEAKTVLRVDADGQGGWVMHPQTTYDGSEESRFQTTLQRAEDGDIKAMCNLGSFYLEGRGVTQDEKTGAEWMLRAAKAGDSFSQFNMGNLYLKGRGVKKDGQKALEWFRKAAEQNHVDAQFNLAMQYRKGQTVEQDQAEAVKWFQRAAGLGDPEAQYFLAQHYEAGAGVGRDGTLAVNWLEKAFAGGSAGAGYQLGLRSLYGYGMPQNRAKALELWQQCANMGDANSREALAKASTLGQGEIPKYHLAPRALAARTTRQPGKIPEGRYVSARINDSDGFVNMRAGPGTDREVVEKIFQAEQVFVMPSDKDWWPCVFMPLGISGYIHKSRLNVDPRGAACEVVNQ